MPSRTDRDPVTEDTSSPPPSKSPSVEPPHPPPPRRDIRPPQPPPPRGPGFQGSSRNRGVLNRKKGR